MGNNHDEDIWTHFAEVLRLSEAEESAEVEQRLDLAASFFSASLKKIHQWPAGFLHGSLALPWCIHQLVVRDLAEAPRGLSALFRDCLNRYRGYFYDSPMQYDPADRIWPVGMVTLAQWSDEDTLFRYSLEEQIIHRIKDCERILTESIPGLHDPRGLHAGVLHSMLVFLEECGKRKIFPYKCNELIGVIASMNYDRDGSLPTDVAILDRLLGRGGDMSDADLADRGFFAFVYNRPELFTPEPHAELDENPQPGIIMGTYCYEKDTLA